MFKADYSALLVEQRHGLQLLEQIHGVLSHLLARAVAIDSAPHTPSTRLPSHHTLLVEELNDRHARLHVRLEALHQRLGVVIHTARSSCRAAGNGPSSPLPSTPAAE